MERETSIAARTLPRLKIGSWVRQEDPDFYEREYNWRQKPLYNHKYCPPFAALSTCEMLKSLKRFGAIAG